MGWFVLHVIHVELRRVRRNKGEPSNVEANECRELLELCTGGHALPVYRNS